MRKLFSMWVPRLTIVNQKYQLFGLFASVCDNRWNVVPPIQTRVKSAVSWVDCSRPKQPNSKNRRQYFWTRTEFCSSTLLRKKKNQQPILHGIINAFENRYYQIWRRKNALIPSQCTLSEIDTNWVSFCLDLASSDYYLFVYLKKFTPEKKLSRINRW